MSAEKLVCASPDCLNPGVRSFTAVLTPAERDGVDLTERVVFTSKFCDACKAVVEDKMVGLQILGAEISALEWEEV